MIFFILFTALIFRLINLNQSLWLDEAVQAITSKGTFLNLFAELRGDFHPPLYHLFMWGWAHLFGSSEIAMRLPSVIFGTATVFVVYLIINELFINGLTNLRINGLIGAIFLATSQFHIYYSQEARPYALATFLTSLSMYFFIKIINKLTNCELTDYGLKMGYFFSTILLLYSDYFGFLVLLAQVITGLIIFRKNLNLYFSKFLNLYIAIFLFYLPCLPILWGQLQTGWEAVKILPGWGSLVNLNFWKVLPLTFAKFAIGRITIFDKRLYAAVVGILGLIYGGVILKGVIKKNCLIAQLLIIFWLTIPVFIAWIASLFVPNYQPFRLLLVLPAFYLLLAYGVSSVNTMMMRNIIAGLIVAVNLVSLRVYYFNPYFWREDWRGVAGYLKKEQLPIVISSDTFSWPLVYYGGGKNLIAVGEGTRPIEDKDKVILGNYLEKIEGNKVAYTSYLADLYDPSRKIPNWLNEAGFVKIKEISFNQIPLWIYENR
ncbi:MAG: glycosyltransferase family 39 protein, partial [Microgenomates group bacterium]